MDEDGEEEAAETDEVVDPEARPSTRERMAVLLGDEAEPAKPSKKHDPEEDAKKDANPSTHIPRGLQAMYNYTSSSRTRIGFETFHFVCMCSTSSH